MKRRKKKIIIKVQADNYNKIDHTEREKKKIRKEK